MKKYLVLLLVLTLTLALVSCFGGGQTTTPTTTPTTTQPTTTQPTTTQPDDVPVDPPVDDHKHSYSAEVTEPTCTEQGYTTYTCDCGDSYVDDYENELGHSYKTVVTNPTCTEQGYTTYTCDCGDSYVDDYENELGHSYKTVVTSPTCTEQGYTTYTCDCGDSYVDDYENELGHSYKTVVTNPTCTEQGYTTYTCDCGDSYVDDYENELGHSYKTVVTSPTCTEQGYTTYTCDCGDSYVGDYVPALGHNMGSWEQIKAPTCTGSGKERRDCSICNYYETRTVQAVDHTYTSSVVTEPTCTQRGYTTYICICGYSYKADYVNAKRHEYGPWRVDRHPSNGVSGERYIECSVCGDTYSESFTCDNHFMNIDYSLHEFGYLVRGKYACESCGMECIPYDVIRIEIADADEEGYYRLIISGKGVKATFCQYGIDPNEELDILVSSDTYRYSNRWDENSGHFREIVFADDIVAVGKIDYYNHVYTVKFGKDVKEIREDSICDLFSLKNIYFEGDLPTLEPNALWRRDVYVEGEDSIPYVPTVYYNSDAKGFENYTVNLQGCAIEKIGDTSITLPDMTMREFSEKAAQKCLEVATEIFESPTVTASNLKYIPYCDLDKYKEIKDLALALTSDLDTDKEKARVIHEWIASNVEYDDDATLYTVAKVFETKKAVCAGYAALMHDMLAAVDIPSMYANGLSYFGTDVTVEKIVNDEFYNCGGHGWIVCYVDGEAIICDPTWEVYGYSSFDISPAEFAKRNIATLRLNEIRILPDEIDVRVTKGKFPYYSNGSLVNISDGHFIVGQLKLAVNGCFSFTYKSTGPNGGYVNLLHEINYFECFRDSWNLYGGINFAYKQHSLSDLIFAGYDFRIHSAKDVLQYICFEKLYYGNQIDISDLSFNGLNVIFDENGNVYFEVDDGLSLIYSICPDEIITIPEYVSGKRVMHIGRNAFQNSHMKEVILPNSIETIGILAFDGCSELKRLVIPESVKEIHEFAFAFCYKLESIILPKSVELIGYPDASTLVTLLLEDKETGTFTGASHGSLFFAIDPTVLKVYYSGTKEDFDKIHLNNPWGDESNGYYDQEQYDHIMQYIVFQGD